MASDMIRDRTVCGILDDDIRKELLNESTFTLESCITMVKSFEATAKQAKTMSHSGSTNSVNHDVSYISKRKQGTTKKFQGNRKPCKFCGQTHVWGRDNCPAYDKRCSSCENKGHFEIKCGDFQNLSKSQKSQSSYRKKSRKPRKSSAKNIRALGSDTSDSQSDTSEFSEYEEQCSLIDVYEPDNENVHNVQPKGTKSGTIVAKMYVHKTREPVIMQVDSGASCNVLPAQYLPANVVLTKTSKKLRMYSNDMVPVLGTCKLRLKNPRNGKRYLVPFYVISNQKGSLHKLPLLGSTTAQQMQLISVNHENIAIVNELQDEMSNVKAKENLCQEYRDVFSGRGCMPGNVTLYVDETVRPHVAPPRRVLLSVQSRLKAELERLQKEGVIERVEEPTDWCSSLCCVEKNNGKLRLCIDPQPLNCALKRSYYPLPVIEDILPELDGVKVFSKADLNEGFLQCKLDNESTKLTTFQSPWGRWKYLRMPQGISPAPELFQQKLNQSLDGLKGIHIVADDVLITGCGETLAEATQDHDNNLKAFLERCRKMNITLKKSLSTS
ncbi:uncharacterized protein K02A2.6-like [Anneissia japonica]|uniref:uncharacterized protein K02A2.6-like n=1 Tax=Anneissia japonica TaxID=1529436 RepID=UPI001425573A|nr:uncharacterized protein K02A2.6-like [Anneissia japonica]